MHHLVSLSLIPRDIFSVTLLLWSESSKHMRIFVNFRLGLSLATALLVVGPLAIAANAEAPTPVFVELFTSEGCSDCPPADAFLRQMDGQPIVGVELIVLEEHVDYWDDQGWKDPFSSHEWTVRQSDYAQRLHVKAPYTPQMIVDGTDQFVGNDRAKAGPAVQSAIASGMVSTQIVGMKTGGKKLEAHIETGPVPANADIFVAFALDHAETQVQRGENGGKKLEHVAILRSLHKVGKAKKGETFANDINLSTDLSGQPGRMIVFVQESGQGRVLGAAMESIPAQP